MTQLQLMAEAARVRGKVHNLAVSEVFGPVWQGEGPATGERCAFLRLGNCNLSCGKGPGATWWCDTPFTWDWDRYDRSVEVQARAVESVAAELAELMGTHIPLLVVSGGEPLLQRDPLTELLDLLPGQVDIDIETNGTRLPLESDRVRRYVCSPKLANSGMKAKHRLRPEVLAALQDAGRQPTAFKFVATVPADLAEVDELVTTYALTNVWIMPSGTTRDDVISHGRDLAPAVAAKGYHLTLRQHVLLYGDERGT